MKRAVLISGRHWTAAKQARLADFLRRYGDAVRFYLPTIRQKLPSKYQDWTDTHLAATLKSAAHRQARNLVISCVKSATALGVEPSMPDYQIATAVLDAKNAKVRLEPPNQTGGFDLFVDVKTTHGKWLTLPCKATKRLRYWLEQPGAKLIIGCQIYTDHLLLWVDIPEPALPPGSHEIGIDVGVNKLIATSDGDKLGTNFKQLSAVVRRKMPGSRGRLRANRRRDQFIRRTVNQLPWGNLARIAIEDLTGLKKGKKRGRGKKFRKAMAPWRYRLVRKVVEEKACQNGVLVVAVPPRGTSRTCPNCGTESSLNRRDEDFLCISCDHAGDADVVGAGNILSRARTMPEWGRHAIATGQGQKNEL